MRRWMEGGTLRSTAVTPVRTNIILSQASWPIQADIMTSGILWYFSLKNNNKMIYLHVLYMHLYILSGIYLFINGFFFKVKTKIYKSLGRPTFSPVVVLFVFVSRNQSQGRHRSGRCCSERGAVQGTSFLWRLLSAEIDGCICIIKTVNTPHDNRGKQYETERVRSDLFVVWFQSAWLLVITSHFCFSFFPFLFNTTEVCMLCFGKAFLKHSQFSS